MKKHSSLKLIACLCLIASLFGFTASAAKYGFYVTVVSGAGTVYTEGNPKNDDEEKAYVTVTSKSGDKYVTAYVYDNAKKTIYSKPLDMRVTGKYTVDYIKSVKAGDYMRLGFSATTGSSETLSGVWNS